MPVLFVLLITSAVCRSLTMAAARSQDLYSAALNYRSRGWSVIPLIGGNSNNGKRAAVAWQTYQNRLPTEDELYHWFVTCGFSAFGVVCGYISKLIVLDFDDQQAAENFKHQFPELANTFAVRSGFRDTPHFYYRVDFPVKSQKLFGGDLKAEGGYVVAAGSIIAEKQWTVLHDSLPVELSKADLKRILVVLKQMTKHEASKGERQLLEANRDFVAFYQREVLKSGQRNNSLFKTALWMRDSGYLQHEAVASLTQIHAAYPSLSNTNENYESRYREAVATIASAYSRPPRQQAHQPDEIGNQLSNALREKLLQQPDGAAFLRTYEGLLLNGIKGGQIVTRPQMFKLLHGVVGEHSIKCALKMTTPSGKRLFAPSPRPPTSADADTDVLVNKANKCFVDQQKPPERVFHRPAKQYVMPTEAELLKWFALDNLSKVSDAVQLDDLKSVKKYRQTLEMKLIERKPGQYPQGWLGDRLGVSTRTLYSYHKSLPIEAIPCYTFQGINWDNVCTSIPSETLAKRAGIDIRGRFLEDEKGKRYPAIAGLAKKLLSKGHSILLKQRTFNFYQCKTEVDIKITSVEENPTQIRYFENLEYKTFWYEEKPKPEEIVIPAQSTTTLLKPEYHKPELPQIDLEKVEQLALKVKKLTAEIDSKRAISLRNVQQLIELAPIQWRKRQETGTLN